MKYKYYEQLHIKRIRIMLVGGIEGNQYKTINDEFMDKK